MSNAILIPHGGPIDARFTAPPSKSLTIRALAVAALARGRSALRRPLFSDDTFTMAGALDTLGLTASRQKDSILVSGEGGRIPAAGAALDLGDAGTPMRLLTALCCLGEGRFVLDGSARMRARPIADLIQTLRQLGVVIRSLHGNGCPPVEIRANGFPGGDVTLSGRVSSQYLSALLIAAPCGRAGLSIAIEGSLVSRPYVDLTLQVMESFGVHVERDGWRRFSVPTGQSYEPRVMAIEGDASSASYLFAAAAVTGGRVEVQGIPDDSRQGDLGLLPLLTAMGCEVRRGSGVIEVKGGPLRGIDADLADMPDVALTLAAVALFAAGPTRIGGIGHLRFKESDRMAAATRAIEAFGGSAAEEADALVIRPPASGREGLRAATIDPRRDHRVAMAFCLPGLSVPNVTIQDPGCVAKSWPEFFEVLAAGTGRSFRQNDTVS